MPVILGGNFYCMDESLKGVVACKCVCVCKGMQSVYWLCCVCMSVWVCVCVCVCDSCTYRDLLFCMVVLKKAGWNNNELVLVVRYMGDSSYIYYLQLCLLWLVSQHLPHVRGLLPGERFSKKLACNEVEGDGTVLLTAVLGLGTVGRSMQLFITEWPNFFIQVPLLIKR